MTYAHIWDFFKDLDRLVAEGATFEDLARARATAVAGNKDSRRYDLRFLATSGVQAPYFIEVRLDELVDGATFPHDDDYLLAMLSGYSNVSDSTRRELLRRDPEVFDLLWRAFEVEGGGEVSLTNLDRYSYPPDGWQRTFVSFAEDGSLDRRRLLRSALEALNRDFAAYRAGWFSRLYVALDPTAQEAAADQDLLLLTLGSPITASVSFAVKHLQAVHRAGLLDAAAFAESCAPAMTGPKATVMTVLRILASVEGEAADEAALRGLSHPHADVQRAAVALLRKRGQESRAREHRADLSPALAAELFPETAADPTFAAVAAETLDAEPEALRAQPVVRWSDEDAVIRFAALLEDPSDAIEFELALAWLAESERARDILSPLTKRAKQLLKNDDDNTVPALLMAAIDPDYAFMPQRFSPVWEYTPGAESRIVGEKPRPTPEEISVLPSFFARLREVADIVQGRAARRPLLATPTDTLGWVAAYDLRARIGASAPLPHDRTQAVLRVPPEDRPGVLVTLGIEQPVITDDIRVEWRRRDSDQRKADGSPQYIWWDPYIHADAAEYATVAQPALTPSTPQEIWNSARHTDALVTAELALVAPQSTARLTTVGIPIMNYALSEVVHDAGPVLDTLARHPGRWTPETVQLVALGMSAFRAELRAVAAELLVDAVPARIPAAEAAKGFAACALSCTLGRWKGALADAATINPGVVVDLLTALLPQLDRGMNGIGGLLTVLLDEATRLGRPVSDPELREWLGGFGGSSAAAKAAKRLLS